MINGISRSRIIVWWLRIWAGSSSGMVQKTERRNKYSSELAFAAHFHVSMYSAFWSSDSIASLCTQHRCNSIGFPILIYMKMRARNTLYEVRNLVVRDKDVLKRRFREYEKEEKKILCLAWFYLLDKVKYLGCTTQTRIHTRYRITDSLNIWKFVFVLRLNWITISFRAATHSRACRTYVRRIVFFRLMKNRNNNT